ncbi:amino acid transporter [Amnibacterium kyonggiense]|uniref:Amino acid permease n=1 Tax=Amnibacterium kyonggiense TaxID=595671 RepID=A0A4R7FFU0_9MICO|nr:amino acid transporter [Amnibacterium kyonggiense]TDS75101.1 amino acid permease [Amnibacterium kyonggiense]
MDDTTTPIDTARSGRATDLPAPSEVPDVCAAPVRSRGRFTRWALEGADRAGGHQGPHGRPEQTHSWLRVMCLTGVDYFSTLGYQPAIAALAAGFVSPIATLVLIALTLLGALPVYRRVASESFKGEGSIAMLERLLPWWGGKLFVLVLLGFAATDFIITITLSAADAAAHAVENPLVPAFLHGANLPVTLLLVVLLGAVFLRGFREAIGIAVVLVAVYLALNAIVIGAAFVHVFERPELFGDWTSALLRQNGGNPLMVVAVALIVFPKLALGLSGFETGVTVIPQIRGTADDGNGRPEGRIRGAKRLLTTAAITMSLFLLTSSFTTTLLIPQQEFQPGGQANGRALAYLAHAYLGPVVGTAYDISTIAILWFAGASAMAGLLNIVPRYLPRYGMAPTWARAVRPLVIVFTLIAIGITLAFDANVDKQGGAYATGVLVLITSASVAVTLSARRKRQRKRMIGFAAVSLVFAYTTVANVIERPDGLRIGALFIVGILLVSFVSRLRRSFEVRATSIEFDETALGFLQEAAEYGELHLVANEPDRGDEAEYRDKARAERHDSHIPGRASIVFLEVLKSDSSDFEEDLVVHGHVLHGFRVLKVVSGNVPNTIATILLQIRNITGVVPEIYFEWTEGNPLSNMVRFLISGEGEVAPVTREVLRETEHDVRRRPIVHVS